MQEVFQGDEFVTKHRELKEGKGGYSRREAKNLITFFCMQLHKLFSLHISIVISELTKILGNNVVLTRKFCVGSHFRVISSVLGCLVVYEGKIINFIVLKCVLHNRLYLISINHPENSV